MEKPHNDKMLPKIGRAKTVIVMQDGDNPVGIVSEIFVQVSTSEGADRLVYKGPVRFRTATQQHLTEMVLTVVDKIAKLLNVPLANYEISVKNPGATASNDIGIEISGFSADLPTLAALLSATLQIGIRQDMVSSGHVASTDGDLAPVHSLPAKLDAAVCALDVATFILPELNTDNSMQLFTPVELKRTQKCIYLYQNELNIKFVKDVPGAIRLYFSDESIVLGSLTSGFYSDKIQTAFHGGHVGNTAELLAIGNKNRFWKALSKSLLNGAAEKAQFYLDNFLRFHIRHRIYPEKFGTKLFHLVISLPPSIHRIKGLFPIIPMELCIRLSQFARNSEYEDVRLLYKSFFGEGGRKKPTADFSIGNKREKDLFKSLLAEISQEQISDRIGKPIDNARSSYVMEATTVKDGFEFNEALAAFYAHIFRHTGSPVRKLDKATISADAIDLVNRAFEHQGGYKAALSEGLHGVNGGMRAVFDTMADRLKQIQRDKYVDMVFKDTIDSLDWEAKVSLMEVFKGHIDPYLPDDLRALSAKQLATDWETPVRYLSRSMDEISSIMKRF